MQLRPWQAWRVVHAGELQRRVNKTVKRRLNSAAGREERGSMAVHVAHALRRSNLAAAAPAAKSLALYHLLPSADRLRLVTGIGFKF